MKVLVVHVPAGSGHEKAAQAICMALQNGDPQIRATLLNGLEGMDPTYQWTFTRGYLDMVHHQPALWGAAYHLADCRPLRGLSQVLHRQSNAWHGRRMEQIFLDSGADVIVGTHFFPVEVAAFLKSRGRISARLITVITDYLPHQVWVAPGIDAYVVGSEQTKEDLVSRGVPADRVHPLGIPIHPKFSRPQDRAALQRGMGLNPGRFTLLIVSGGFGTGPVGRLVQNLRRIREPMQVLVVSGKNAELLKDLEGMRSGLHHTLIPYGFVENLEELMSAADLFVTKPGGLSCAEGMCKGLPIILIAPIPGQESRNARILEQIGAGILSPLARVPTLIEELKADPKRRRRMSEAGRQAAAPNAALEAARLIRGER